MKTRLNARKLTREDVVFILEMRANGIRLVVLAHFVYDCTPVQLKDRLKTWDAL